jgi:AcrR family transcriptional regulator
VLSADQIASVAIAIADRDGVDALSMRRVANALGCGTMSLYRHVRTKEELLDLMIDTVAGEDGEPPEPSGDWRTDLSDAARRLRAVALRHPWLPRISAARRAFGPHALANIEFALRALDGYGLPIDDMAAVVQTVHAFVNGFVLDELAEREWRAATPRAGQAGIVAYLQHLAQTGQFPLFTRLATEGNDTLSSDARFEWQLQHILDGLTNAIPPADPGATR